MRRVRSVRPSRAAVFTVSVIAPPQLVPWPWFVSTLLERRRRGFVAGTGLRTRADPELFLGACTEVLDPGGPVQCEGDLAPWVGLGRRGHHRGDRGRGCMPDDRGTDPRTHPCPGGGRRARCRAGGIRDDCGQGPPDRRPGATARAPGAPGCTRCDPGPG